MPKPLKFHQTLNQAPRSVRQLGYRAEHAKLISIDKVYGVADLNLLRAKYLPE